PESKNGTAPGFHPTPLPAPSSPSVAADISRGVPRLPRSRPQHHYDRAHFDAIVEIDHILVGHPDAAGCDRVSDPFRPIGAVDAVQRVLPPRIKVNAANAHR